MKRIAYSFLLAALLSGCGANYLSGGNGISIRAKSGAQKDYKLLSVRDNSLVVIDSKEDASLENSFSHAEVIRFDSIYKVYRKGSAGVEQYLLFGTAGLCIGALVGGAIAPSIPVTSPSSFDESTSSNSSIKPAQYVMNGGVIGMAAGFIAAYLIPVKKLELHPLYPKDEELLRQISAYPDGEPEMLKLVR